MYPMSFMHDPSQGLQLETRPEPSTSTGTNTFHQNIVEMMLNNLGSC